jgi:Fur family ferric uptake transcriptional regulator
MINASRLQQLDCGMGHSLLTSLKSDGRRMTRPRKAILAVLERTRHPISVSEIHTALTREKISVDLVTVYRTLSVFKQLGMVSRVEFQEGQFRYELCHGRDHHHHIRCRGCGRIADLMLCPLKKVMAVVERETRFLIEDHSLEFIGWCPQCR